MRPATSSPPSAIHVPSTPSEHRHGRAPTALLLAVLGLAACSPAASGDPSSEQAGAVADSEARGRLVIVGGGLQSENGAVYRPILDGVQGSGPFCVLPTASGVPEESMASSVESFRSWAARSASAPTDVKGIFVTTENPEAASDPGVVRELLECSGFWFTGGVQSRVTEVLRPAGEATPGYAAIMERFEAGAVVAGTSAGAAMMPPEVIAGGSSAEAFQSGVVPDSEGGGVIVETGMDFFDGALIDQHFLARGRIGRLLVATLAGVGGGIGLGIDENTAVVVDGSNAAVVGASGAVLVDARGADRSGAGHGGRGIRVHLVGAGDAFDLETLEIQHASNKGAVATSAGEVAPPEDVFARWAFLGLLADLARTEDDAVEMTAAGYTITVEKAPDFHAVSYGVAGVQDTPRGLSVGPLIVSAVPIRSSSPPAGPASAR